jgi:hypothetical protein
MVAYTTQSPPGSPDAREYLPGLVTNRWRVRPDLPRRLDSAEAFSEKQWWLQTMLRESRKSAFDYGRASHAS